MKNINLDKLRENFYSYKVHTEENLDRRARQERQYLAKKKALKGLSPNENDKLSALKDYRKKRVIKAIKQSFIGNLDRSGRPERTYLNYSSEDPTENDTFSKEERPNTIERLRSKVFKNGSHPLATLGFNPRLKGGESLIGRNRRPKV